MSTKTTVAEPTFYHTTIKEWPEGDRPRERLIAQGAENVSDAELLAILIRTGNKGTTAVGLARKLLSEGRTLRDLAGLSVADLVNLKIGKARATAVVAAFELSRRVAAGESTDRPVFSSPEDVSQFFAPRLRDKKQEEFWVLMLNSANRLLRAALVTKGTLNTSLVHPRECFHEAIKERAASVIFLHNHPSGNPEPSQEDIAITKQLVESGKVLGIPVHDHLIVAGTEFTSFADRRLL